MASKLPSKSTKTGFTIHVFLEYVCKYLFVFILFNRSFNSVLSDPFDDFFVMLYDPFSTCLYRVSSVSKRDAMSTSSSAWYCGGIRAQSDFTSESVMKNCYSHNGKETSSGKGHPLRSQRRTSSLLHPGSRSSTFCHWRKIWSRNKKLWHRY